MNCAIQSGGEMTRLLKTLLKILESESDNGMQMVKRKGLKNGKRCILGQRTSGSVWPRGHATWVWPSTWTMASLSMVYNAHGDDNGGIHGNFV